MIFSFKSKDLINSEISVPDSFSLFIWLCVESRDSYAAKDGLIKYRTFFQQQAPESLENILNYLLDLSEARVNKTLKLCRDVTSSKMDDLEEGGSPEDLLLATVTTDGDRVRNEVGLLKPWLGFAWENLRTVLDLLRNNTDLEAYHDTAIRAFAFCLKHERRQEFMRLSASLRDHLSRANTSSKELSSEILELHLATRYEQLQTATSLHLWVAGFNTIEDIHGIIVASSKVKEKERKKVVLILFFFFFLDAFAIVDGNLLSKANGIVPSQWKLFIPCLHLQVLLRNSEREKQSKRNGDGFDCASIGSLRSAALFHFQGFEATEGEAEENGAAFVFEFDNGEK